jgi:DNA-binding MarR family transcriptional regulator
VDVGAPADSCAVGPDQHLACAGAAPGADVAGELIELTRIVQAIHVRVCERHDLAPMQARLLRVLLDGPRQMAELAKGFGVEKAALTGLMDRAERRGLAQRSAVPGDRRALQATLTEVGRRTALAFREDVTAELVRLTDPLTAESSAQFRAALGEILQARRDEAASGSC